ncbi:MAG: peptidoglycan-binding domain-containing protein [bacterium]|nr:peptidoglycan-binding domain-containing protein [bacterium]
MKTNVWKYTLLLLVSLGLVATGCSSTVKTAEQMDTDTVASSQMENLLDQKNREISELRNTLNTTEQQLQTARSQSAMATTGAAGSELLPPNAKPGECYARVYLPAQYATETETVVKSEPGERIEVIPARYEWVQEQVKVKEASTRLEVIPAQYKTVTEKILEKPEHTVWKKGTGPITRIDEATGEIMCLVTVPASYKTVTKRILVSPETTREVEIPAEYKTVKVKRIVQPAQTKRIPIPAKYETVTKRKMVSEGKIEWRPVLCKTNMSGEIGREIQLSLKRAGFDPGPIDGLIGRQTLSAVTAYQKKKGLPTGGLTLGTLKSLGVNLK